MKNERYSERAILDILEVKEGKNENGIFVYAQETSEEFKNIRSKYGTGKGRPEFFITQDKYPNTYIVIECKNTILKQPLAEKEVKHYMSEIQRINPRAKVFGIAFSGDIDNNYSLFYLNNDKHIQLTQQKLTLTDINNEYIDNRYNEISDKINKALGELNLAFHSASLAGSDRSKFLASIIGSSTILGFYDRVKTADSTKKLISILEADTREFFEKRGIEVDRTKSFMSQITSALYAVEKVPLVKLWKIIDIWEETTLNLESATKNSKGIDILGRVFNEFLRYVGSDKKSKGQVLTPDHFADLFVTLADLKPTDTVIDITCGTGSFLVHALTDMFQKAKTSKQKQRIKELGVWGNDNDANMTLLAMLNLVLHGDGVSNIRHGDALHDEYSAATDTFKEWLESKVPKGADFALINPPYFKAGVIPPEPAFIKRAADLLKPGGMVIAIHPISVLLGNKYKQERKMLLENHTLIATMIAPSKLFEAGVETAISVWKAHRTHTDKDNVWFADWSDDGFKTVKNKHRQDVNNSWTLIRDKWVEDFKLRKEIPGYSVNAKKINCDSEWTLFPYVETDYESMTEEDFMSVIEDYYDFKVGTNED